MLCTNWKPNQFDALYGNEDGSTSTAYGKKIKDITSLAHTPLDVLALLAFLRKKYSDREIASGLLGNGTLPLNRLSLYVDLIKRTRAEVLLWLRASGF